MGSLFMNETGQGMVEYGLILGLIAVVVAVTISTLSSTVDDMYTTIDQAMPW